MNIKLWSSCNLYIWLLLCKEIML